MIYIITHHDPLLTIGGIQSHAYSLYSRLHSNSRPSSLLSFTSNFTKIFRLVFSKPGHSLIHVHGYANIWQPILVMLLSIRGHRSYFTLHYHLPAYTKRPQLASYYDIYLRICLRYSHNTSVLCLSKTEQQHLSAISPKTSSWLLPFGTWCSLVAKRNQSCQTSPFSYSSWITRHYMMIFLGRVSYNKSFDKFLQVVRNNPDLNFIYVGPSSVVNYFEDSILPQNLEIHTSVSNHHLSNILLNVKYLFTSSTYESFSQTPLEAHIHGCLAPILFTEYKTNLYPALPDWPRMSMGEFLTSSKSCPLTSQTYSHIRRAQSQTLSRIYKLVCKFSYFGESLFA